jgi:hypothetical protein
MLVEAPHLLADFDLRADPVDGLPCVTKRLQRVQAVTPH